MKPIWKAFAVIQMLLMLLLPLGVSAQVLGDDTVGIGTVNDTIRQNEGVPIFIMPDGTRLFFVGPGNNPSGIPGGGQVIDVADSVMNALSAAFFHPGPSLKGEQVTDGMLQLFAGNPTYVRKFGSVKSGVMLNHSEFTWGLGNNVHLFGDSYSLDRNNKHVDFKLRTNEKFRFDLSYGRLIHRVVWHSGDHGDYILDTRNWHRGTAVSSDGNGRIFDPIMTANGADFTLGNYIIYHNLMVMGMPMMMGGVPIPDYWMVGIGGPMDIPTKRAMEITMRYTPKLETDFHAETQFRPVPWFQGILGYQSDFEGGQKAQHMLSFVFNDSPGVTGDQLFPLPTSTGAGAFALPPAGVPPEDPEFKDQWVSRQITMVRDPLSYFTQSWKAGLNLAFQPVEAVYLRSHSDFRNNQIVNPFLVDILQRPFGWDMATTLATLTPTGQLFSARGNYAHDAGQLVNDYRTENNHWSRDQFRLQIPLQGENALQFKFNRNLKRSDGRFFNVEVMPNHPAATLIPPGMMQITEAHRSILQLPTFATPQVDLNTFQFSAPLKLGSWRLTPNFDSVYYASSPGMKGMPNFNASTGGFVLQHFGPRHNFSVDFSLESKRNSAVYENRAANSFTIHNPIMNPDLQAGWLPFLPHMAALWAGPPVNPVGGPGSPCAIGQEPVGTCPGPQGSLGSVSTIIANNPTHPVGLRTIDSTRWNGTVRYSQRLSDSLSLKLNAGLIHNNNPYYRTDASDENSLKGQLTWKPSPTFWTTLDYTHRNSRNSRFLFPERRILGRGSLAFNWQPTSDWQFNASMSLFNQGIDNQTPILGTGVTNGVDNQIIAWLLQFITPAQNLATMATGNITPIWSDMLYLPDRNSISYKYRNKNSLYTFGFSFQATQNVSLFGNWSHSALTASWQGTQKIQNVLELPFGFDATNGLWGFNTPPNLNVRQNSVSAGIRWKTGPDASLSLLGGVEEYQDLARRLSRFGQFSTGLTPPAGGIYLTSLASFGMPTYPLMLSPDTGKVVYFTVRWSRKF